MRDKANSIRLNRFKIYLNLTKSKIFLIACLVFIGGIAAASWAPEKFWRFEIWWFVAAVFFLAGAPLWRRRFAWLLWLAVFCLAIWRYGSALPAGAPDKIRHYNGRSVTVIGYLADEPDVREANQKLEIAARGIKELPGREISGKVLVTANVYPEYNYGDSLELNCELEQPEEYKGFAYDRYLARYNIYSVCYRPALKVTGSGGGGFIYAKIFSFKKKLIGLIESGLPEPESGLAKAVVFGGQRGIDAAIRDNFQKAGLSHIMAVSGFHVSIMAAVIMAVLLGVGLNRRRAFYLAAAALAGYIVLVGLPASAMRAGLMAFLVLWALKLGRLNKLANSLLLAAALLLLINPRLLADDVGFQLSFLAVIGLAYIYPITQALWQKAGWPKLKGVSDALLITLAAQVFTLPVLAYSFGRISLIAPLANLAVLWAAPPLIILTLIGLPLAALAPGLSFIVFLPSYLLAKYILGAVAYLAGLPYASLEVNSFNLLWAAAYYALAVWGIIKLRRLAIVKDADK
ncbi:MAG: ComEC/Rec2 family competence protein [bacterium]|nr:ComEC/Rec2 family competence protein [bacterium]